MSAEEKKKKRLESRKRKMEAYIAVAELNDTEKNKKRKKEDVDVPVRLHLETKVEKEQKPQIFGEEFQMLKEKLKARKKMLQSSPYFRLKSVGEDSLLQQKKEERVPLFMSDLQALLTYCLCGDKAPYWPHRWCTLQKWNRLTNIVCVILDGLSAGELERSELPWISANLEMMEVVSPASYDSSVAADLALIPISNRQRNELIKSYGSLESALENQEAVSTVKAWFPVSRLETPASATSLKMKLLLSAKQLIMENYPISVPGTGNKFDSFSFTREEYFEVHDGSPLYSIDCEMCLTDSGEMELTRICVVDDKLEVVYHSLVKPFNNITNYLTQYSGITKPMLEGVETRLSDVQAELRRILPGDCILVGQSLNSDLNALKMMHPYVIDTSVIFNITGERRRKTKLSTLANIFLNLDIQTAGKKGHSPEEDAKAAMSLVLKKLEGGYNYGDVLLGGEIPGIKEANLPAEVDDVLSKDPVLKEALVSTLSKSARVAEKTVALTVTASSEETYNKLENFKTELHLFQTGTDNKEVLEKGKSCAVEHNLSITHFNLNQVKESKRSEKAEKFCQEMFSHTSANGLFLVILPGDKETNASAGLKIIRPPELDK